MNEKEFGALRSALQTYCPLSDGAWAAFRALCVPVVIEKHDFFTQQGQVPHCLGFVCSGLLRAYVTDQKGTEYTKIFFAENSFPGSMVALLNAAPSDFAIEALEASRLLQIDFKAYRRLLQTSDELKWFHILYLEKNWVINKEARELALAQESATTRYLSFLAHHPTLERRVPQYHIASHLGITPTQLSRIRRRLAQSQDPPDQPM